MSRQNYISTAAESERRRALKDRCWMVPFGVAVSAFLLVMVISCYGYVAVLLREKYGVNHEKVSWIGSTVVIAKSTSVILRGCAAGAFFTAGLLVSQLQHKISVYHISLIGGCLASAGLVASGFASDIGWLNFTFGIMHGTGMGTALLGLCLYLLLYFDEYRGTATAIMWIFRATSGMAGMPLLWNLTARYGVQGCLLVMGGLVMNCVPVVMLIRSPRPCHLLSRTVSNRSKAYRIGGKNVESPDTKTFPAVSLTDDELPQSFITKEEAATSRLHIVLSSLTSFPFYVLVFQSVVSDYVFHSFTMTIVAYAVDKGFELHQGNQVVVRSAVGLLIGRIVVPFATDKIPFSRCPVAALCYSVVGVSVLSLAWVQSYGGVVALAVLKGVAEGYILCIKTVLIADYQGVSGVSFCCGVGGMLTIPVWPCGPRIIGFFRDTKGSYDRLYVTFTALCFTAASLLAYLTYRDTTQRKQRRKRRPQDDGSPEMEPMNTDVLNAKTKHHVNC